MNTNDKDITKKSLWRGIFRRIITILVYTALRPKIMWEDKGLKKQAKKRPFIFVCNHTNHLDGPFAGAVFSSFRAYTLVTNKWYNKKKAGALIKLSRSIPISLDDMDTSWYARCEKVLEQGNSLLIFPEGGIAREGRMQEFKPGAGLLSAKTGTDIVPAAIYGEYSLFFGKRQKILIGSPIKSDCPKDVRYSKYSRELMQRSENEVRRLYKILEDRYGRLDVYKNDRAEEKEDFYATALK